MNAKRLIIISCLLFIASACSVNKRAHRPGYNVEWRSVNPKPQKHPKLQEHEEHNSETEILAFGTEGNQITNELEDKLHEDAEMKENNVLAGSGAEVILNDPFHFTFKEFIKPKNLDRQRPDATNALPQEEIDKADKLASLGFWLSLSGLIGSLFFMFISAFLAVLVLMIVPLVPLVAGIIISQKSLRLM